MSRNPLNLTKVEPMSLMSMVQTKTHRLMMMIWISRPQKQMRRSKMTMRQMPKRMLTAKETMLNGMRMVSQTTIRRKNP